jgi:transcriptional regulator with PAS, ATPase and Fis domain
MPYELQAVLLRVLQDKEVARIGSKRTQVVNFRLIAATNHNLWQMVEERTFREDLYYRLSVLTVEIPPLRERKEDIILLAEYFIEQYANRIGKPVPVIGDSAREVMMKYNWPGNVRQLENAMIYAVNMTENITIEANHLPKELFYENQSKKIPIESWKINTSQENFRTDLSLKEHEKQIIERTLAQTNNTVSIAAKILGISKTSIYRKMKEYGIEY